MSGSQVADGLEFNCTFAEGSQAQSCILTVCNNMEEWEFCKNVTVSRSPQSTIATVLLNNLPPGIYVIREVGEVERDGTVTFLSQRELVIIDLEIPLTRTG